MERKRRIVAIPALRAQSPDALLSMLKIDTALSPTGLKSTAIKPGRMQSPSESMTASTHDLREWYTRTEDAYTGLSRISHRQKEKLKPVDLVQRPLFTDSKPVGALPTAVGESPGAKEKAAKMWAKRTSKRNFLRVKFTQKALNERSELATLGAFFDVFQSVVGLVRGMQIVKVDWFALEGRVEAVANLMFLEKELIALVESNLKEKVVTTVPEVPPHMRVEASLHLHKKNSRSELPKLSMQNGEESDRIKSMEIAKLQHHIELLANKLAELQARGDIAEAECRAEAEKDILRREVSRLESEILAKDRGLAVLQNQVGQMKDQTAKLVEKVEAERTEKELVRSELRRSEDACSSLEMRYNALDTRLHMLLEDCYRFSELYENHISLREKFHQVSAKLKKLELDVAAGTVDMSGDSAIVVQLDDPIFRIILPTPYKDSKLTTQTFIDLAKFRTEKPTFANFVSREIPLTKADIADISFPQWMEVTIRGLYDAKYAEHLLFSEGWGRSAFPEFVYAWMGQYNIDEKKREIIPLDWSLKELVDARRYQLLLSISTDKAKKVWEVWTFREFLMEELDLDTLSFYLHCRQLLFEGPQLMTNVGKYAAVHYVPLSHAFSVIDLTMNKLPAVDRNVIKSKLEDRSRDRGGSPQIDAAFVLRLFIVYYEREKREKFRLLESLFQQAPKVEGKFVDFSGFRQIVQNFSAECGELEMARFYRNVWKAGGAGITPESFFTAANESAFLSSTLHLNSFWPQPSLNAYNELESGLSPLGDCYAFAVSDWRHSAKRLEVLKEAVTRLGLMGASSGVAKIEAVLKRKGQLPLEDTNGRNLSEAYIRLWTLLSQAAVVQLELYGSANYAQDQSLYASTLQATVQDLKDSCRTFHACYHSLKVEKLTVKFAVNRIQRAWKATKPQKKRRKSMRRGAFLNEFPSS